MPESGFLNFLNFFAIFFQNFLAGVQYKRNSGLKFVSPTLSLSHPVLARNIAEKRFFDFFNIFAIFFGILLPGRVWTEFGTKIFFSLSQPISPRFG